jgi:flagellar biosynthesis/type III secretory pathway protein FliH
MWVLRIRGIEESSVYQDIFSKGEAEGFAKGLAEARAKREAEGRLQEVRETLIFLGRRKLGPPDERAMAEITALNGVDHLLELSARISDVASWDELFFSEGKAEGDFEEARKMGRAEGHAEEARKILLRLGSKKFGQPDEAVRDRIAALSDLDRLQDLLDRLLDVATWDEVLASPES